MNDIIANKNQRWAFKELKALELTRDKMIEEGLMDERFNEIPNDRFSKEQIQTLFQRRLEHYQNIIHHSSEPITVSNFIPPRFTDKLKP